MVNPILLNIKTVNFMGIIYQTVLLLKYKYFR